MCLVQNEQTNEKKKLEIWWLPIYRFKPWHICLKHFATCFIFISINTSEKKKKKRRKIEPIPNRNNKYRSSAYKSIVFVYLCGAVCLVSSSSHFKCGSNTFLCLSIHRHSHREYTHQLCANRVCTWVPTHTHTAYRVRRCVEYRASVEKTHIKKGKKG